jgi:hypothetical protein
MLRRLQNRQIGESWRLSDQDLQVVENATSCAWSATSPGLRFGWALALQFPTVNVPNEAVNMLKTKVEHFSEGSKAVNMLKTRRLFDQSRQHIENTRS